MTFFLIMNSGGKEGRKEGRTDGLDTRDAGCTLQKSRRRPERKRDPLKGQPKPTTTTTITSTHREDAHHNSSTLDTQLVENAITRTILLETTYIQHSGLISCPYLPAVNSMACGMYVHCAFAFALRRNKMRGRKDGGKPSSSREPNKLRDRPASISYYLISYSRTTLSYY
jgi:hypothetical protein